MADDAAKSVILDNSGAVTAESILDALAERRSAAEAMNLPAVDRVRWTVRQQRSVRRG